MNRAKKQEFHALKCCPFCGAMPASQDTMSHDRCPRHPLNTFMETPNMTFAWQTKIGVAFSGA